MTPSREMGWESRRTRRPRRWGRRSSAFLALLCCAPLHAWLRSGRSGIVTSLRSTRGIVNRLWKVEESVLVGASVEDVYAAVSCVRNMGKWSPECFAVWHRGHVAREGTTFVGFNRKGLLVWFTTCRVTLSDRPSEFAFRVTAFGLPVALWGYRFRSEGGVTRVTEYWEDLRTGRGARTAEFLGRVFTGTRPADRAEANRAGMRTTLGRPRPPWAAEVRPWVDPSGPHADPGPSRRAAQVGGARRCSNTVQQQRDQSARRRGRGEYGPHGSVNLGRELADGIARGAQKDGRVRWSLVTSREDAWRVLDDQEAVGRSAAGTTVAATTVRSSTNSSPCGPPSPWPRSSPGTSRA